MMLRRFSSATARRGTGSVAAVAIIRSFQTRSTAGSVTSRLCMTASNVEAESGMTRCNAERRSTGDDDMADTSKPAGRCACCDAGAAIVCSSLPPIKGLWTESASVSSALALEFDR